MNIFDFLGKPEKEESDFPCDGCKHDNKTGCCDYNTADDYCVLGDKREPVEEEKPVCKFSGHSCNKEELFKVAAEDNPFCPHVCCRFCSEELCGARCNGAEHVQDLKDEDKEGICECCGWWNRTNGYMGMVPGCFWEKEYPEHLDDDDLENHTCWMPNVELMKVCGSCEHSNSFLYSGDVDHPEEDNDLYCDLWHFHNRHPENRRQLFEGKRRKNFGLGIYHRQHEYDTCDCWERKR